MKRISPWHSPEYFAERQPVLDAFNQQMEPLWTRFLAGEMTRQEYLEALAPITKQYVRNVTPTWEKHGGPK
jgi:hypothetical protein